MHTHIYIYVYIHFLFCTHVYTYIYYIYIYIYIYIGPAMGRHRAAVTSWKPLPKGDIVEVSCACTAEHLSQSWVSDIVETSSQG